MSSHIIPFNTKLFYGIGQLSEGMTKIAFSLFVLFFYTQLLGIPGYYTGAALCIALIFDAFADLWIGILSDKWHSKWGRRHPFMLISALPLAISFYFLFSPPDIIKHSDLGLAVWLTLFAILTRFWTSVFQVPYLSLGAELSSDGKERTKIVSFRYAFSNIGVIITLALGFSIFFVPTPEFDNGQMNLAAYSPFAFCLSLFMIGSILITVFGTYTEISHLVTTTPLEKTDYTTLETLKHNFNTIKVALKNNSFRALLSSLIISFIMVGIVNNMSIFMLTFFWELNTTQISIIASIIFIGILGGGFLTPLLHIHWDKKHTVIYSVIAWIAFLILPTCLRLLGWFPENGNQSVFWILLVFRIMEGLCLVQAAVSFGSMIADITDEHRLATGKREEGIFFGASSFASKCSDGLGTLVAGLLLDIIHFPTGANLKVTDIPADVLFQLGVFYGPLILIPAIASLWCCSRYELTREKHNLILKELENKPY